MAGHNNKTYQSSITATEWTKPLTPRTLIQATKALYPHSNAPHILLASQDFPEQEEYEGSLTSAGISLPRIAVGQALHDAKIENNSTCLKAKVLPSACITRDCSCPLVKSLACNNEQILFKSTLLKMVGSCDDAGGQDVAVLATCVSQYISEVFYYLCEEGKNFIEEKHYSGLRKILGFEESKLKYKTSNVRIHEKDFHSLIWEDVFKNLPNSITSVAERRKERSLINAIMQASRQLAMIENVSDNLREIQSDMENQLNSVKNVSSPDNSWKSGGDLSPPSEVLTKLYEENKLLRTAVHDLCKSLQKSDAQNLAMHVNSIINNDKEFIVNDLEATNDHLLQDDVGDEMVKRLRCQLHEMAKEIKAVKNNLMEYRKSENALKELLHKIEVSAEPESEMGEYRKNIDEALSIVSKGSYRNQCLKNGTKPSSNYQNNKLNMVNSISSTYCKDYKYRNKIAKTALVKNKFVGRQGLRYGLSKTKVIKLPVNRRHRYNNVRLTRQLINNACRGFDFEDNRHLRHSTKPLIGSRKIFKNFHQNTLSRGRCSYHQSGSYPSVNTFKPVSIPSNQHASDSQRSPETSHSKTKMISFHSKEDVNPLEPKDRLNATNVSSPVHCHVRNHSIIATLHRPRSKSSNNKPRSSQLHQLLQARALIQATLKAVTQHSSGLPPSTCETETEDLHSEDTITRSLALSVVKEDAGTRSIDTFEERRAAMVQHNTSLEVYEKSQTTKQSAISADLVISEQRNEKETSYLTLNNNSSKLITPKGTKETSTISKTISSPTLEDIILECTTYCNVNDVSLPLCEMNAVDVDISLSLHQNGKLENNTMSDGSSNFLKQICLEECSSSCSSTSSDSGKGESETCSTPEELYPSRLELSDSGVLDEEVFISTDSHEPHYIRCEAALANKIENSNGKLCPHSRTYCFPSFERDWEVNDYSSTLSGSDSSIATGIKNDNNITNIMNDEIESYDNFVPNLSLNYVKTNLDELEAMNQTGNEIILLKRSVSDIQDDKSKNKIKNFFIKRCKSLHSMKDLMLNTSNFRRHSIGRTSTSSLPAQLSDKQDIFSIEEAQKPKTKSIFKSNSTRSSGRGKPKRISFGGVTRHYPPTELSIVEPDESEYSHELNDELHAYKSLGKKSWSETRHSSNRNSVSACYDSQFDWSADNNSITKERYSVASNKSRYSEANRSLIPTDEIMEVENSIPQDSLSVSSYLNNLSCDSSHNSVTYFGANVIESPQSLTSELKAVEQKGDRSSQEYLTNLELEMESLLQSFVTEDGLC